MSVTSKRKLFKKLNKKEYRDNYCEEHVKNGISYQVMALRDQRGWSQSKLAEEAETVQSAISRIESPDYGSLSISTLTKLANAFDIGLIVKFVPFSKFLKEKEDLSKNKLEANCYINDLINVQAWAMDGATPNAISCANAKDNLIILNANNSQIETNICSAASGR